VHPHGQGGGIQNYFVGLSCCACFLSQCLAAGSVNWTASFHALRVGKHRRPLIMIQEAVIHELVHVDTQDLSYNDNQPQALIVSAKAVTERESGGWMDQDRLLA
jgi:hypothetical protein